MLHAKQSFAKWVPKQSLGTRRTEFGNQTTRQPKISRILETTVTLQARIQKGKGGLLPAESFRFADELIEAFADDFAAVLFTFFHEFLELLDLFFQGRNLVLVPLLAGVELFAQRVSELVLDFFLFLALGLGELFHEFVALLCEFGFFPPCYLADSIVSLSYRHRGRPHCSRPVRSWQ